MIIPNKHKIYLSLLFNNNKYYITSNPNDRSIYHIYKHISDKDYELLGTSNSPIILEQKIYKGVLK